MTLPNANTPGQTLSDALKRQQAAQQAAREAAARIAADKKSKQAAG